MKPFGGGVRAKNWRRQMAVKTLEDRVEKLEHRLQEVENRLAEQAATAPPKKRGWRWFVGINANDPDFEEAVLLGQQWRYADRPSDDENCATMDRQGP